MCERARCGCASAGAAAGAASARYATAALVAGACCSVSLAPLRLSRARTSVGSSQSLRSILHQPATLNIIGAQAKAANLLLASLSCQRLMRTAQRNSRTRSVRSLVSDETSELANKSYYGYTRTASLPFNASLPRWRLTTCHQLLYLQPQSSGLPLTASGCCCSSSSLEPSLAD